MRVAIVGGGIIGLASAWKIATTEKCEVTLFDAHAEAREASWAAAGMLAPHDEALGPDALWELSCMSYDLWPSFLAAADISPESVDFHRHQSFKPTQNPNSEEFLKKVAFARDYVEGAKVLGRAELKNTLTVIDEAYSEMLCMPAGQVDPRRCCTELRKRCEKEAVRLLYEQEVSEISKDGFIKTAELYEQYDQIVIASGAWTSALAEQCGLDLPGEPVKGQMLRFDVHMKMPGFIHSEDAYCVPRSGSGLIVGATMEYEGFDRANNSKSVKQLQEGAQRLLPQLRGKMPAELWTGLRPRLVGGLPLIDRVDERRIICTGHFRNGILLTPISATLVSRLISGVQPGGIGQNFTLSALKNRV